MCNTRLMTTADYDPKLDREAQELRRTVAVARAELRDDPEGCFGGRGNNFGYAYVEDLERQLNWYLGHGYHQRTHVWFDMIAAGLDLSAVEKVSATDKGVYIYGSPGNRRIKVLDGKPVEVNWIFDRKCGEWRGQEPPPDVLKAAQAMAAFHGADLFEWRGVLSCPRVYL